MRELACLEGLDVRPTRIVAEGAQIAQKEAHMARCDQSWLDGSIEFHIGAHKAVDRLFGIADDEKLTRNDIGFLPVRDGGIVASEKHQNLDLEGISVLKLIHEVVSNLALQVTAD